MTLDVQFLGGEKLVFSQTDQFDPPPAWNRSNGRPLVDQWHFTAATPAPTVALQKGCPDRIVITRVGATPRVVSLPSAR